MHTQNVANDGHGDAVAKQTQDCNPTPKWAAVVDDSLFPMPRQHLEAGDILAQSGAGLGAVLIRDYNSPHDVILHETELVDLADGNVFRLASCRDGGSPQHSASPAKLAFVCDDAWEVTVIGKQSGRMLKHLLGLADNAELFRDYESPIDKAVADDEEVEFAAGCVFTAKRAAGYCVNIEGTTYPWSKATITTAEIRNLGGLPPDQQVVCEDEQGNERTLSESEVITLDPCCRYGRAPKYKRG
jgi:hypothetical protein